MKQRRCFWMIVVTGVVTLGIGSQTPLVAQAPPASKVEVQAIKQGSLAGSFTFVGTVHPARRAVLGSAVEGRLEEIVDDGMWVRNHEPLARLRTETIDLELAAAVAEQELRQHELEELQAGPRKEEREMAKAKLESAQALATYAKARYDRTKALFERGQALSQEEMEQAHSAFVAADKARAASQSEHELAENGTRAERIAQAKDRLLMQTAIVQQLRDRQDKFWLRPYFNGYVTTKYAEVGAWIKQGDPLVEIVELDPVEITVNIPEAHVAKVRPDMDAQVRIDSVSMKDAFVGKVARIVPQADLRSRTFAVKVRLQNPEEDSAEKTAVEPVSTKAESIADTAVQPKKAKIDPGARKVHKFKSGMLAHVMLRLGEKQDALLAPKDALVLGGSSINGQPAYQVFVAKTADGGKTYTAQPVQVAIGMYDNGWVEITGRSPGELTPGTLLVTIGNERLQPGQPIQFQTK